MATTPSTTTIDVQQLVAFDVHVHLEHTGKETDADKHAAQYFKGSAPRDAASHPALEDECEAMRHFPGITPHAPESTG